MRHHLPANKNQPHRRDGWDKLSAVSGVLTWLTTVVIAGIGWAFTAAFKEAEQRAADLTIAEKMLPHLVKEGREAEAAIALMATLSRAEVAAEMATLYGGPSSIDAMRRLAANAPTSAGKEAASRALLRLSRQGSAEDASRAAKYYNERYSASAYGYSDPGYGNYDPDAPAVKKPNPLPDKHPPGYVYTPGYTYTPAREVHITSSGPLVSGAGKSFSELYLLCGTSPNGYRIVRHEFRLAGDRTCGAWATCELAQNDESKTCYRFALQGHEELPWPGQRTSEGILRIEVEKKRAGEDSGPSPKKAPT